jgi:DNA repair exonuclease SbcCD ATPase subunit
MNLRKLIKRADNVSSVLEKLEADLADAVEECLELDAEPRSGNDGIGNEPSAETDVDTRQQPSESPQEMRRMTTHTQSRIAALSSFDGLFRDARLRFEEIDAKLSELVNTHHLTCEFFHILHADILRANELELANLGLVAEHRGLSDRLNELTRKQHERESVMETLQQREASLSQDNEGLRGALAAARLELVEAANASARNEAEFGALTNTLAAVTVEADRRAHENKMLREKNVSLSVDLEKALKREDEARHRLDEFSALHANEAARSSEMISALGKSEKEAMRLQKSLELAQAKLSEVTEASHIMEQDKAAELERCRAEIRGSRSEIQNLQSRLELASSAHAEASNEVAKLKLQWSDALAEKQVADERLAALIKETETDKLNLSKATANLSQLSLQQASDHIQLDIRRQECEDLRAEIAEVNARIRELLPYERLHRIRNAAQTEGGSMDVPAIAERAARTARRGRPRPRAAS